MYQVVSTNYAGQAENVAVMAIDDLPSLRSACCWKLDVEGHELAVRANASRTLPEAQGGNQLWVHNFGWAQERLQTAPAFSLLGERI